jgi:hypothetical protein
MPFDPKQSVLSGSLRSRNIAKYGHVLRISRQQAGQFLCSLDLLAEREGFEPSVLLLSARNPENKRKSSRVRQVFGL